ncbi:MAG: serine/threonine protein kinase [Myxococcales bacterium]|nr:serine/threonine protein kinase [Myxococcales bacterium]
MSPPSNRFCPRCGLVVVADATHCGQCGQHQPDRDDPPESWLGRVIDEKYEIEAVLGVGGMGMVFRAKRVLVGDHIALKVLFPRFLESPVQRQLFRDEAIAAARLSHPNVVTVFDAELSTETGLAYIAMELLRGTSLKQVLSERAPMPVALVVPIVSQICDGLTAAHAAHVVHRDLKPDNIFLEARPDGTRRVKLVDFGIAAMLDADPRDEQRRLLGTLRYMSPEQCRGEHVDARTDLYSLGVIIYEALTRKRATGKTVTAVLTDVVAPPNHFLPDDRKLPLALEQLVLSLLAKRPDDRPSSALEVRDRLRQLVEPSEPPVPSVPPAPSVIDPSMGEALYTQRKAEGRPPEPRRLLIVVASLTLFILGVAFLLRGSP